MKIKVRLAGREVDFADREVAIRQVEELAREGTYLVPVIYGPEGCGKTAFFRQAAEVLKEHGYAVVHVNPAADEKLHTTDELKELKTFSDAASVIDAAVELLNEAAKRRRRIALLIDDVSQAFGLDKAEQVVIRLLNALGRPSANYEKAVVLVATSESASAERIGRHRWADLYAMWNTPPEGFRQLYDQLPGEKPPFDEVWRWTGGNPGMLERLYLAKWDVDSVIGEIIRRYRLNWRIDELSGREVEVLREAVDDPDALLKRVRETPQLADKLVEMNLVVELSRRDPRLWVDQPPPQKDLEVGVGKYYAWPTPLHREAARRALEETRRLAGLG